ncbi:MAG: hypothetical protein JNJ64_12175 [Flavobacteriales bacterium]|nr:hypothetical protein [Flavobacteriales bacterium]
MENLRIALTITLSILLLLVLLRRFRDRVVRHDLPVAGHAELIGLQVAYHPARLLVRVRMPQARSMSWTLLDQAHHELHRWPDLPLQAGDHAVELALDARADGIYHLQMASESQRTIRRFRLAQG